MNPPAVVLPKVACRHTKIIFTLGPASAEEAMLEQLILAGVDVCRLNMAHADHAWTRAMIQLLMWGVEPFLVTFSTGPEQCSRDAFAYLLRRGWVQPGNWMVVVTNVLAGEKTIDTIQMRPVE